MKGGYVYILANAHNTVLYIGVTSDLIKRIWEHKGKFVDGFTKLYNVDKLVYYEAYDDIESAIKREKRLKKYKREQKDKLIIGMNPGWLDLYEEITL